MPITSIVLGAVLIILIYVLYIYFYANKNIILAQINDCSSAETTIDATQLTNPTGFNFSYAAWIYVNNWSTGTTVKNVWRRNGSTGTSGQETIRVYLDKTSPTLYVWFYDGTNAFNTSSGLQTTSTGMSSPYNVMVTNNFPLQKWCYLFISVDSGQNVDIYLDGKMVRTAVLQNSIPTPGDTTAGFVLGQFTGYIANLQYFPTATDPQTVWNYYMKGNSSALGVMPYGLTVDITKNNAVQSSYKIV